MKTDHKLKTAVVIGLSELFIKYRVPFPLQKAKKHYLNPMSQEDKHRAQGLKPFNFPGGVIVWSINQKNATKKYLKRYRNNE